MNKTLKKIDILKFLIRGKGIKLKDFTVVNVSVKDYTWVFFSFAAHENVGHTQKYYQMQQFKMRYQTVLNTYGVFPEELETKGFALLDYYGNETIVQTL